MENPGNSITAEHNHGENATALGISSAPSAHTCASRQVSVNACPTTLARQQCGTDRQTDNLQEAKAHKTRPAESRSILVAYLALWKVADEDFPIAPNPTPTARPSETGRKKTSKVNPCNSPRPSLLLHSHGAETAVSSKAGPWVSSLSCSFSSKLSARACHAAQSTSPV